MTEAEKKRIHKELQEETDLVTRSVDFWAKQIEKVFAQIDDLDENDESYEDTCDKIIARLEHLIKKADHEEKAISDLEEKLYKFIKNKDIKKSRRTKNKKKKNS
jgi:hypothetical protein